MICAQARARKKKRGPEPDAVPSGLPVDLHAKKKGKARCINQIVVVR